MSRHSWLEFSPRQGGGSVDVCVGHRRLRGYGRAERGVWQFGLPAQARVGAPAHLRSSATNGHMHDPKSSVRRCGDEAGLSVHADLDR
jgi:hypothetical protein